VSRTVPEWIGKTPDTPVPPRVRLRVLKAFGEKCADCTRPITPGVAWTCDHIKALINGGENRERNLRPLCDEVCNPKKNETDVGEKSKVYKKRAAYFGVKPRRSRPMPGGRKSNIKITMAYGPVDRRTGEPLRRRS
jgi:5-methylcytosine-specific restriction enzyme A